MMSNELEALQTLDDEALFERWAGSDPRAGHVLFGRYFDALRRFFRRQIGDDAQDLVQNTFLGCVQGRDRFKYQATFRTYLYVVARNQLYKELRRRSRRPELDFRITSLADLGPTPSRVLNERDQLALLVEALGKIPIEQQVAIDLYYLENMTAPQVAKVLELSEPKVRHRLKRGLDHLRQHIEGVRANRAREVSEETLDRWAAALPPLAAGENEPDDDKEN